MKIERAVEKDEQVVLDILQKGRQTMEDQGNKSQWTDTYPGLKDVREDMKRNSLYKLTFDGEIEAVFSLIEGEDPTYREIYGGSWLNNKPYVTIHRIASRGRRKNLLDEILSWSQEAFDNIRIDTHEDNTIMKHILKKNNFVECGYIRVKDKSKRIAFHWSKN